jgi:hypothetical protein
MGDFSGQLVSGLAKSILIPEVSKCLSSQTVRNMYRGPVSETVRTFMTEVEAVYGMTLYEENFT